MSESGQQAADWSAVVDSTLEWSHLSGADLAGLAELRAAIEYVDDPVEHRDLDQFTTEYLRDRELSGFAAVVGRDSAGTIVAYAWNHPPVNRELLGHLWLDIGVHPAWRHRRIGRRLLEWSVRAAREWYQQNSAALGTGLWLGYFVDAQATGLRGALADLGFTASRWYFDLHRLFDGSPLNEIPSIPGISIEPYRPALSEQVRAAHNEILGNQPGGRPAGRQEWEWSMGELVGQVPSFVALADQDLASHPHPDHGRLVGFAINTVYPAQTRLDRSEGWTARFGVCPSWRARGIGSALVIASMHAFAEHGLDGAGLGLDTDNPEEAQGLMATCGFVNQDGLVLYALPQADLERADPAAGSTPDAR